MKTAAGKKIVVYVILACFTWVANASGMAVSGTITDANTGQPVPGVLVMADKYDGRYPGFNVDTRTDATGKYTLAYSPTPVSDLPRPGFGIYRQLFNVYSIKGNALYNQLTEKDMGSITSRLPAGVYLVTEETSGMFKKMVIARPYTGFNVKTEFPADAYKAAASRMQTDTLLSFSRDGYTTSWAIKDKNIYNIKLVPRTSPTAKPGPGNTGPTGPLRIGGSVRSDQVTEGRYFPSQINIAAANATLRNFVINSNDEFMYGITKIADGVVLEDGEILNMTSTGIYGMGFTARRLNIHESGGDAIKPQDAGGPVLIERCWFHHLGSSPSAHADAIQSSSTTNTPSKIVIKYCHGDMPHPERGGPAGYKSNAFFLGGRYANILIEKCWINGGNYSIYCSSKLHVKDCLFGRDYKYGVRNNTCGTWSGNVWEDNGQTCK